MKTLFFLFNHTPTDEQVEDARISHLQPVTSWLEAEAVKGDHVLIQGDGGAVYLLLRFAFKKGLIAIYSTTERRAREEQLADGSVKMSHFFSHVRFREYGR